MRFSLSTLVLVVLWLSAITLVWMQREAWVPLSPKHESFVADVMSIAPDKRRRIEIRHIDEFPDSVAIVENADDGRGEDGRILWERQGNAAFAFFEDNDTISIDFYTNTVRYHRRHPEWWWGHFYRPEVWMAMVLSAVLVWKLARRSSRGASPPFAGHEK